MKQFIVTTTIYPPSEALVKFDALPDWTLIVAGDKKTPPCQLARGIYLSPEEQERRWPELSAAMGWNCIQRRNFGFLLAAELGADVVASVDDDNIPMPGWGECLLVGQGNMLTKCRCPSPIFDPIEVTNYPQLWHRGFPISLVATRRSIRTGFGFAQVDVQADFWQGDPDVDAICRTVHQPKDCIFEPSLFPFTADKPGPFNSQNTFFTRDVLRHYMVLPGVGRMDDIWPAYYVQALGFRVAWNQPTVLQKRNPHDWVSDFEGELSGYTQTLRLLEAMNQNPEAIKSFLPGRTVWAWELYKKAMRAL